MNNWICILFQIKKAKSVEKGVPPASAPKGFDSSFNGGSLRNGLSHRVAVRGETPRRRKTQGNAHLARECSTRQLITNSYKPIDGERGFRLKSISNRRVDKQHKTLTCHQWVIGNKYSKTGTYCYISNQTINK